MTERDQYWRREKIGALLLFIAIGATSRPLAAQEINLGGVARTISAYTLVEKQCGSIMNVDHEATRKVIESSLKIGTDLFGLEKMREAVRKEVDRRAEEVKATGIGPWCSYQQAHLEKVGMGWIFGK
jgi:hypothetical protein